MCNGTRHADLGEVGAGEVGFGDVSAGQFGFAFPNTSVRPDTNPPNVTEFGVFNTGSTSGGNAEGPHSHSFDPPPADFTVGTAVETRPVNVAVNYIIKL